VHASLGTTVVRGDRGRWRAGSGTAAVRAGSGTESGRPCRGLGNGVLFFVWFLDLGNTSSLLYRK